ncbi:Tyrosine kinase catalytic domain protein [Ceratobasidium sp. AG-Ba]|nr:Tyrosine kinase catalytic domain protein [Ceratobasidium sp. AG-Ba]
MELPSIGHKHAPKRPGRESTTVPDYAEDKENVQRGETQSSIMNMIDPTSVPNSGLRITGSAFSPPMGTSKEDPIDIQPSKLTVAEADWDFTLDKNLLLVELAESKPKRQHLIGSSMASNFVPLRDAANPPALTVHGDLKALNNQVSDEGVPMLMDFSNAVLKERTLLFTSAITHAHISPRWTAPEILSEGTSYTKPSDIYALGMVRDLKFTREVNFNLMELVYVDNIGDIYRKIPYPSKNDTAVMYAVSLAKETPKRPEDEIPISNAHRDRLWDPLMG